MQFFQNIILNDIKTEKSQTIQNDVFGIQIFEQNLQSPFQEQGCLKYKSAIQTSKGNRIQQHLSVSFNQLQLEQQMSKSLNYQQGTGLFVHSHSPKSKQFQIQPQTPPLTLLLSQTKKTYNANKKSIDCQQQLFQKYLQQNKLQQKQKHIQNLNKFFEYIYDFKTCKIGSYSPKGKNSSISSRNQQEFCLNLKETVKSQVYQINFSNQNANDQNMNINISQKSCSSTYSNGKTRLVLFKNKQTSVLNDQKNLSERQIHFGYECNRCKMDPIVGERYHCQSCDFDLCKQCYYYTQNSLQMHQHETAVVQLSTKGQQNLLEKALIKSQEFKNRQKCNFNNCKVTKSAIIQNKTRKSLNQTGYQPMRKTIAV